MPNVAIADTGKPVRAILQAGSNYFKKANAFYSQALSEANKLATIENKYNFPTQYRKVSSSEFQEILQSRDGLSEEIVLDFAEQLMIFEECGNVYANAEFVQAYKIPGLKLQSWAGFLGGHGLALGGLHWPGCRVGRYVGMAEVGNMC